MSSSSSSSSTSSSSSSSLLLLLLPLVLGTVVDAALTLKAHRVLQLVSPSGAVGSQRAIISLPGVLPGAAAAVEPRALAVLPLQDSGVDRAGLEEVLEKPEVEGALVVIPDDFQGASEASLARWKELEALVLQKAFSMPLYFVFEDVALKNIMAEMSASERYQFVVGGSEPSPQPSPRLANLHTWLRGSTSLLASADSSRTSTIAIVAHYDVMSASPSLSFGVGDNGSGVVALLSLLRSFARLYTDSGSRSDYDVVFVLTSAGNFGYNGARKWLKSIDAALLERLELVLCLEDLSGPDLHLHVSGSTEDNDEEQEKSGLADLINTMKTMATKFDRKFSVVKNELGSARKTSWEHEHFARNHIVTATLSSRAEPAAFSSIFDIRQAVSTDTVVSNIKFLSESLSGYMFSRKVDEVFRGPNRISPEFVSAWLDFFGALPRYAPSLSEGSAVVQELRKELSRRGEDTTLSTFVLDPAYTVHAPSAALLSEPTSMSVYKLKPFTFDIMLSASIASYLTLFYFGLKASV